MNKIINWVLSFTKIGKVFEPVQKLLSGKKAYLSGGAIAVPALLTMLTRFSDQGTSYLLSITGTPEWTLLLNGLAIMGLRAAITKAADPSKDPNEK